MSNIAISFEHVSKMYQLGVVGTGTISNDLKRWWYTSVLGKEDPFLRIGQTNNRASKAKNDYVYALRDIDFQVEQGDVVGIIGKNGAGKSTLLKLLSRITAPTTGCIKAKGRIASLLEVGTGFHPELTGRENIYLNGSIMGMTKKEIDAKFDEIVDFSGCEMYIDTPTKRYSSGMQVRLGFAVAAFLEPEILVVDEVLAVGDAEFQKKAIGKMQDVSQGQGRTVLFVSHNMNSVRALCKHGVVLKNGMIDYIGAADDAVDRYMAINSTDTYSSVDDISNCRVGDNSNYKIVYESVKMLNDPDNMATEEPIRLQMKVRKNDQDLKQFQVGIFISNASGNRVSCCYTDPISIPMNKDVFNIEVTIPHHNLAKGFYSIDVKLSYFNYVGNGIEYDQLAKVAAFEVKYVDEAHTRNFAIWIPNYGSSCMRDVKVTIIR